MTLRFTVDGSYERKKGFTAWESRWKLLKVVRLWIGFRTGYFNSRDNLNFKLNMWTKRRANTSPKLGLHYYAAYFMKIDLVITAVICGFFLEPWDLLYRKINTLARVCLTWKYITIKTFNVREITNKSHILRKALSQHFYLMYLQK